VRPLSSRARNSDGDFAGDRERGRMLERERETRERVRERERERAREESARKGAPKRVARARRRGDARFNNAARVCSLH